MAITTTSLLPSPVQQSFSYKLLSVKTPYMIHNTVAMKKVMPANGGNTLRMRRYNPLDTATVPLGNSGVTPPPQTLTAIDIDARIQFYGTYVELNEQVTLQNQDPVLNEAAIRLGVSLRQTEDVLTRDMLAATASTINAVAGGNGDMPTNISFADVQDVVRMLLGNDAYTITDNIMGEDRFDTSPVRDAFFGMCHTDLAKDLDGLNEFIQKNRYPSPMNALRSEWGALGNVRFLIASIGSKVANSSALGRNVYNVFIAGLEAYAYIEQNQYSATFIYRPPMYSGPLAQNCTVGYKAALVPRITNDEWIFNLKVSLNT